MNQRSNRDDEFPRPPAPPGAATCRICGCWHYDPCEDEDSGPCSWVEADLCSACAPTTETTAAIVMIWEEL